MNRMLPCIAAAAVSLSMWAQAATAQMVQVAPGYVRAPFVRVYTGPGGTRVQAPFVDVGAGGFRGDRGRYEYQLPGPDEFAQMDWRTLRQAIRELSQGLDNQLGSLNSGDKWKVFLKTAEIRALASSANGDPQADASPVASSRPEWQRIVKAFEMVRTNPEYRSIANLSAFQALHGALAEFLAPPEFRTRRQLIAASEELDRALEQINARSWKRYFALPESLLDDEDEPSAAPNPTEVAKVLGRFDQVSREEKHRVVASLPAFQVMHQRLAAYMNLIARPSVPGPPPPEELPTPAKE